MKPVKTYALGVTGGIGGGKSLACRYLEALGARVFNADAEAKKIMNENEHVKQALRKAFGAKVYDKEGALDRRALAQKVFGDREKIAVLNRIVHPLVFAAFDSFKRKAGEGGYPLVAKEAALIFESGSHKHLDGVLAVLAPEDIRLKRVAARDGSSEEEVRKRMAHQWSSDHLREKADFVIDNTGTAEELKARVKEVYRKVTDPPH